MFKFFIIALVLVGGVLLQPDLRASVKPHIQFLIDPVESWQVNNRVEEITRKLEAEGASGAALPGDAANFKTFLSRSFFGADAHLDPWGNPYVLQRQRVAGRETSARVVSAGPDGKLGTADDIRGKPLGVVPGR